MAIIGIWPGYKQGLIDPGRGHATPHMPVETAKCWWLLKIEPNTWVGSKGSCAVCVDLQAVGALEFFGELYSLARGFGPIFEGVWAGFREREGSIFSNHQHFAVSTGICGVACPLPASRVDKPLVQGYLNAAAPCMPSWSCYFCLYPGSKPSLCYFVWL